MHKALVLIHILGTRIGLFPYSMKFNHSVLNGSDEGRLWRLLCSLVHPKTQHLDSLFGADIIYLQQLQQVIGNGGGGCSVSLKAVSMLIGKVTKGLDFFPSVT